MPDEVDPKKRRSDAGVPRLSGVFQSEAWMAETPESNNKETEVPELDISAEFHQTWSHWLPRLRCMAQQTPEPEVWLARLDAMERWLEEPARLAKRLVDLMVTRERSQIEFMETHVADLKAGRDGLLSARRCGVSSQLAYSASLLLVALGPPAREELLQAYAAAGKGAEERPWFLCTLSVMGDRSLEPFFDGLQAGEVVWDHPSDPLEHFRRQFEYWCARNAFDLQGAEAIYAAVTHQREGWRWAAVLALQGVSDERATEALRGRLEDPAEVVRSAAQYALDCLARRSGGQPDPASD